MHMGDTFVFKQMLFPRIAGSFCSHEKSHHGKNAVTESSVCYSHCCQTVTRTNVEIELNSICSPLTFYCSFFLKYLKKSLAVYGTGHERSGDHFKYTNSELALRHLCVSSH